MDAPRGQKTKAFVAARYPFTKPASSKQTPACSIACEPSYRLSIRNWRLVHDPLALWQEINQKSCASKDNPTSLTHTTTTSREQPAPVQSPRVSSQPYSISPFPQVLHKTCSPKVSSAHSFSLVAHDITSALSRVVSRVSNRVQPRWFLPRTILSPPVPTVPMSSSWTRCLLPTPSLSSFPRVLEEAKQA